MSGEGQVGQPPHLADPAGSRASSGANTATSPEGGATPQLPRNVRAVRDAHSYKPAGRTIVICLDGTGDKFDADNSNIVHLVGCLKKSDPSQITYYQSGIGTYDGGGLTNGFNAAMDMAVGSGLGVHVRDSYRFLMQNYRQGDKICLFGFSRGAYTARCLAGMVHKVGLLPAHNRAQIPFAYQYYKDDSPKGWQMSEDFKKTFCMDVNIYFVGVFDSVASVGVIPRKLPLSATPYHKANYFRHAMALDERRSKFKACRFQQRDTIYEKNWEIVAEKESDANGQQAPHVNGGGKPTDKANNGSSDNQALRNLGHGELDGIPAATNALEVWFAGCHCDVGGGAVKNEVRNKLAQIPLRWMIRQCFDCNTGIIFKTHRLAEEGLDVQMLYPDYIPLSRPVDPVSDALRDRFEKGNLAPITKRSSALSPVNPDDLQGSYHLNISGNDKQQTVADVWLPEQVEDHFDALQPMMDQLKLSKSWWILELWPIKVRIQPKDSDTWVKKVRMNLGRHRPIQEHQPNLHWTVEERMARKGYKIKTRVDKNATWNVVA